MNGFLKLSHSFALRLIRDWFLLFWTLFFPAALFILFVLAFGGREADGTLSPESVTEQLGNLTVVSLVANGLFSAGMFLAQDRARGVLRFLYTSGVSRIQLLGATLLRQMLLTLLSCLLLCGLALLLSKDFSLAHWSRYLGISLLGALSYGGVGLAVAALARTPETASAVSNMIYFPSVFFSGAMIPLGALPDLLRPLRWVIPSYYLRELFHLSGGNSEQGVTTLACCLVLLSAGLLGYLAAHRMFQWK